VASHVLEDWTTLDEHLPLDGHFDPAANFGLNASAAWLHGAIMALGAERSDPWGQPIVGSAVITHRAARASTQALCIPRELIIHGVHLIPQRTYDNPASPSPRTEAKKNAGQYVHPAAASAARVRVYDGTQVHRLARELVNQGGIYSPTPPGDTSSP
jgi:hypothetical protein